MKRLVMGIAVTLLCACGMRMNVQAETVEIEKSMDTLSPYTILGNDENGIPDVALYEWLLSNSDYDCDGELTVGDLEQLEYMVVTDTTNMRSLEGIQYCNNLTTLYLDGQPYCENPITDFSPLVGLTKLESLSLSSARLTDISFLSDLVNLKFLSLSGNQITDITPLAGMTELETLWLDDNQINDVTALADITKLESLGLRNNQLITTAPLAKLTEMFYLDLSDNQIDDLSGLSGMTKLDELDLTNNRITDISSLSGLKQLRNLLLGQNQLTSVSALSGFTNLETLRLDANQVTDISNLKKSTEMIQLFLAGNQISDISVLAFMPKVEWLEINDNQITNIRPVLVMKNLRILDASNNQISNIEFLATLEHVSELRLNYNKIVDVSPLSEYLEITMLELAHNEIVDPSPLEALSSLYEQLWVIDLSYNKITDVSGISGLREKGMVKLDGNTYELSEYELREMYLEFVDRSYYALMNTWISETELNDWIDALLQKKLGAKEFLEKLIYSDVFQSRQLSDEDYICTLCMGIADYWPEEEEIEEWVTVFSTGTDRQALIDFLWGSDSFRERCETYHISMSIETEEDDEFGEDTDDPLAAFVERMYTIVLGRDAVEAEVNEWVDNLRNWRVDGAELADGFVNGTEFKNRGLGDSDYVDVLYRAFMNREADENGKNGWVNALAGGMTREEVLNMFIDSTEFRGLCEEYGIVSEFTKEDLVTNFVERMYTVVLNREAIASDVKGWADSLLGWTIDGAELADGFINSSEFKGRNLSDSEYLDVLYRAIMNREADQGGKDGWMNAMAGGMTREEVLNEFIKAPEFDSLCEEYGILAIITQEDLVRGFVERMYTVVLGREAAESEVDGWTQGLLNQSVYGAKVAYDFIASPEFESKNVDNGTYVEVLYQALFKRVPSDADKAEWVENLESGMTRREALINFLNSEEFEIVCTNYGILRGEVQ